LNLFVFVLAGDTRTLDTLNEVLLAEQVHNDQRSDNHQTAGVSDSRVIQVLSCVGGGQRRRNIYYVRHKNGLLSCEEYRCVEVVGPLPREREQEYGDHHRDGKRENDLNEGSENARSVDVSRLLKLVGNSAEELSEQEDVQTVLKAETGKRENDHRPVGVGKRYAVSVEAFPNSLLVDLTENVNV